MTDTTYNGWTNYETWAVGMFLDGNYTGEGTYHSVLDLARGASGVYELADDLKSYLEEELEEVGGITSDLLSAAVSEVNWHELAEHKWEEVAEDRNFIS